MQIKFKGHHFASPMKEMVPIVMDTKTTIMPIPTPALKRASCVKERDYGTCLHKHTKMYTHVILILHLTRCDYSRAISMATDP